MSKMVALAERLSCHWGGGGSSTTTTSSNIPSELKPLVEGSRDRMLGLQNYFWGDPANMGSAGGRGVARSPGGGWGYGKMPPGGGGTPQVPRGGGKAGVADAPFDISSVISGGRISGNGNKSAIAKPFPVLPAEPPGDGIGSGVDDGVGTGAVGRGNPVFDPRFGGGLNIQGANPRDVAGASNLQRWAGSRVQGLGKATDSEQRAKRMLPGIGRATSGEEYASGLVSGLGRWTGPEIHANEALSGARGMVGKRIGGDSVQSRDPAMAAAVDTFNTFEKPMIEDAYTEMGLGRSGQKGEQLSLGLSNMLLPQIQASQQRAERGLDRDLQSFLSSGSGFTNLGGLAQNRRQAEFNAATGLGDREQNRKMAAFNASSGLGALERARKESAIDTGMRVGGEQRRIEQERKDAPYDDFLRRAALGENILTGPFGGLVPSTIGGVTRTSSRGK